MNTIHLSSVLLCVTLLACSSSRAPNSSVGFGAYASLVRSNISGARERSTGGFVAQAAVTNVSDEGGASYYFDAVGGLGGGDGAVGGHLRLYGEAGKVFGFSPQQEHGFTLRLGIGTQFLEQADATNRRLMLPSAFAGWVYHDRSEGRPNHIEVGLRSSFNLQGREGDSWGTYNHDRRPEIGLRFLAMSRWFSVQAEYSHTFDDQPVHTLQGRGCVAFYGMVCLDGRYDRIDLGSDQVGVAVIQLYFMVGFIDGRSPRTLARSADSDESDVPLFPPRGATPAHQAVPPEPTEPSEPTSATEPEEPTDPEHAEAPETGADIETNVPKEPVPVGE